MELKQIRGIASVLLLPLLWGCSTPLVCPDRLGWDPSLAPQTAEVNGYRLFYVVKGQGEPVLLLHGYGAGVWVWEKQIEVLSRSYRVYALDLLGHGYSDRPKINYTPEAYIESLKGFMDAAGIERAHLIGNSMGGGLAMAMALFFPERVKSLVLIDAMPPDVLDRVQNESFRTLVAIKDVPLLPYLVIASRSKKSVKWLLEECMADIRLVTPELVKRQFELSRIEGSTWVLYSTFKHAREASKLLKNLARIPHPTLLLWGKRDMIFPPTVGEELHRAIPRSTLRVIEHSGHIPMWESSGKVNDMILSFLRDGDGKMGNP